MSERYDWLIIGGGPAAIAAARGYRDAGGEGSVAIVTDEHRMPYRRPPLTKQLLRGEISEDELPLESEDWLREQRISLISGRAVSLDAEQREVMISGGRALAYRDALLATGAEPTRIPVPGADHPGVRIVRALDHVRELIVRLRDGEPVIVIGSGFIGCEIAASLRRRAHPVTLISDESEPNAARLVSRRPGGSTAGSRRSASSCTSALNSRASNPASSSPPAARKRRPRFLSWPAASRRGSSSRSRPALSSRVAPYRSTLTCARPAGPVRRRRRRLRRERQGRASSARGALGRRARPGRGRRPKRGGRRCRLGRRARLLVDDRRPHAQVRRVGRRL